MAIVTSKFDNVKLGISGSIVRDCTTRRPDGMNIGRIDAYTAKSLNDIASRVRRRIIKDGSEFGKGEYVTTVVTVPTFGSQETTTHIIRFTI